MEWYSVLEDETLFTVFKAPVDGNIVIIVIYLFMIFVTHI